MCSDQVAQALIQPILKTFKDEDCTDVLWYDLLLRAGLLPHQVSCGFVWPGLETFKNGGSTTPADNLVQYCVTVLVKKFFLTQLLVIYKHMVLFYMDSIDTEAIVQLHLPSSKYL